jgi:hypothetical protein
MSYTLLTGLYYGEVSNADLAPAQVRERLHVSTELERVVPTLVARGLDVVLTGNPGDGKSHLVRLLLDARQLERASVVPDLSATSTPEVVSVWQAAVREGQPFVLCANEGPLIELLEQATALPALASRARELRRQLGSLVVRRKRDLPPEPREAALVDLADRSVLDPALIERALARVCSQDFLPSLGHLSMESSAGRNLLLLAQSEEARRRLARILSLAGQRSAQHVTFRQLWACIAYGLTGAKAESTLRAELSRDVVGLGTYPLDQLTRNTGRGPLIEAVRTHGDPALVTDPELDEQLWTAGQPSGGEWLLEQPPTESPARLWAAGQRENALTQLAQLKRLVALAHERGAALVQGLVRRAELPSTRDDAGLRSALLGGLRALYLSPPEAGAAPGWLREGLPLWLGFSYREVPPEERPHVAVSSLKEEEFEVLRPVRAPWLGEALGPLPETVWLSHKASGLSLPVTAELMEVLALAAQSAGPLPVPEPVQRFISVLSGWEERRAGTGLAGDRLAILRHPRGPLEVEATTQPQEDGKLTYA